MQDSLKDYIKISNNIKPSPGLKTEELASEIATAECKKKSQDYAQKVVEFMIDGKLKPQIFTRSLNFIDVSLYDDIVEERAISKLCGYPLCGKQIPDMPEKKYIILAKVNKIYDLSERKKYCSNFCYKASCHIKKQIDDSPLWLRKPENHRQFVLLEKTNSGLTPGEAVLYNVPDRSKDPIFTSVIAFTEACLHEAEQMEQTPNDLCNEDDNIKFESNESSIDSSKSILKNKNVETTPACTKNNTDPKKVSFIDQDVEPSTSSNYMSTKTQQEEYELQTHIQNLCKSLNLKLDIKETSEIKEKESVDSPVIDQHKHEDIEIDIEKMNNLIAKINESEKHRNKPTVLIETDSNPEITKHLDPPKYSQRLFDIMKRPHVPSDTNIEPLIKKVKDMEITKTKKVSKDDEKMKSILEKLKNKMNNDSRKSSILINTVQNPDASRAKLKENANTQQMDSSALKYSDFEIIIESFKQWVTMESFLYLYGENTLRRILSEEKFNAYLNKMTVSQSQTFQQQKYADICKKLHMKDVLDDKLDARFTAQESEELKPMPGYNQLKEEIKSNQSKVQAFYTGELIIKNKTVINNKKIEKEENDDNKNEIFLPLADVFHSTARMNIFQKSIATFIRKHMLELSLEAITLADVNQLIRTFKFDAKNIVFKPRQWDIIALILLYSLRKRDEQLDTPEFQMYIKKCVITRTNSEDFFSQITSIINDVDAFVMNYIGYNDSL